MSEIKPKIVDGEAVCPWGDGRYGAGACPQFDCVIADGGGIESEHCKAAGMDAEGYARRCSRDGLCAPYYRTRVDELEAELSEQARLLGMGGEREARLIADRDEAIRQIEHPFDASEFAAMQARLEAAEKERDEADQKRELAVLWWEDLGKIQLERAEKRAEAAEAERDALREQMPPVYTRIYVRQLEKVIEGVREWLNEFDDGRDMVYKIERLRALLATLPTEGE